MRFNQPAVYSFESPNDPDEQKTVFGVTAISYTDTLDAQNEAGPVPIRGLTALRSDQTDDPAADRARDWLARYDLAVCARGVKTIDGQQKTSDEVRAALNTMRPTSAVRLVISDLALKIAEISAGDPEKKD